MTKRKLERMKRAWARFRTMTPEVWQSTHFDESKDGYQAYLTRKAADQWSLMRKLTAAKALA